MIIMKDKFAIFEILLTVVSAGGPHFLAILKFEKKCQLSLQFSNQMV